MKLINTFYPFEDTDNVTIIERHRLAGEIFDHRFAYIDGSDNTVKEVELPPAVNHPQIRPGKWADTWQIADMTTRDQWLYRREIGVPSEITTYREWEAAGFPRQ